MALYPRAIRKLIPAGANDPAIKVVGAILHVAVSNADSLFSYFNGPSGGIESHFYVRADGTVEQYRDTGREADANLKANSFVEGGERRGYVSIETAGMESGEWTAAQLASIKSLLTWLSREHGFPLRRCPKHTEPGVGYHTMFGAPGPWTPVSKSCPGPDRVRQFDRVLVPWMDEQGKPKPATKPKPSKAPVVSLAHVVAAARRDPAAPQGAAVHRDEVLVVERALAAEKLLQPSWVDGSYGTRTLDGYGRWQRKLGYRGDDADGIPGRDSLTRLGKRHGFEVKA